MHSWRTGRPATGGSSSSTCAEGHGATLPDTRSYSPCAAASRAAPPSIARLLSPVTTRLLIVLSMCLDGVPAAMGLSLWKIEHKWIEKILSAWKKKRDEGAPGAAVALRRACLTAIRSGASVSRFYINIPSTLLTHNFPGLETE